MTAYPKMTAEERKAEYAEVTREYEELKARGMNDSAAHVDFMLGTADLSITGYTKDGREIAVFRDGNWAF